MIQYLNVFFYDIYPYICATVFFLGSWLRYDYGQYTWRASSSQMLDKRGMVIWSNLFHIGILGIFFGHLFGMLTPHWMYAWFLPVAAKQLMAMVLGGICGVLTLIGGAGLLWRRLTNQRVRATSTTPDSELGHSETAFLLHSDDSDVRIRYFTPTVEVPICGHATVAAHYVRAKVLGLGNCTIWQTSLAGKHRVTIEKHNDDYRISLEQGTPGFELPLEGEVRAAIINALHLTEDDILPGLPIQVATTGHSKVMIPLKPEVDIDALSPDLNALTAISKQIGCNGFFPFQIRPGKNETDGRMFSPAIGIVEDPVTGNANGPMGAWLVHHNVLPHDGKVLRVKGHQGRALGRDGVIEVTVTIRDNQPEKVTISGAAVILFHAEWAIKL